MTNREKAEVLVCISCVKDVRYSFVSYLSKALRQKGIDDVVFDVDSYDQLSMELKIKVEKARVSVMVLPENCDPNKNHHIRTKFLNVRSWKKDHVVVPVLYGDSPLQRGEWLDVLDLRGLSPIHQSRREWSDYKLEWSDSKLVEEIVRDVYEKLFDMERIGIYTKLLDVENMINKQPIGIRCVGIWGMPGIGKTTLAKAVFDQMFRNFDAHCFIEDYDKAIHENGLYRLLEEKFLNENPSTGGIFTSLSFLKNRLSTKRVLVVLDDVRNALVAESFLEEFDWFGPESLIIITSRDKQVFCLCRTDEIYEVQGLNENEALQVFMRCASIKSIGVQYVRELSTDVIKYASGNPLALSIYGRKLKDQGRPSEMITESPLLKRCPPREIVEAIKASYETLSNTEKNIFLDIACFFIGENVDYVMQLLEGCGFFPHVGIDVLVEKCLVTISEKKVQMHNMIQDFGRQLVNGETEMIERRSRLWEPCSIRVLLKDVQGSEEIEGMFLDTSNSSFSFHPAAFENMLDLRLLKIYSSDPENYPNINFECSLHSLPDGLRLLHWENYPVKHFPEYFDPRHLVEINMPYSQLQKPYSQLQKLRGGTKNLEMLRTIRLCHSQQLVNIDDLKNAQNIEVIDLQGCTKLQSFPATGEMLHLRVLNLSGCREIKSLSEIPPNIEMLHLQGTGIEELPLPIVKPNYSEILNHLAKIQGLSGVSNLETDLKSFINMQMSKSRLDLGKLICLDLKDCSRLESLPDMVNLGLLRVLDLSGCSKLQTIQGFPRNLKELNIAGTAVRQLPHLPQSLELFNAHGCFDLSPEVLNDFLVKALANVKHMPRELEQEVNEAPAFSFCPPSHRNLNSRLHMQPGYSVMIILDTSFRNSLVGFAMLVEVTFSEDYDTGFDVICVCRWRNKEGHSHMKERNLDCWAPGKVDPEHQNNHIFVFIDVNMRPGTDDDYNIWGDLVVFEFFPVNKQKKSLQNSCKVTGCGVRVINAESVSSLENIIPVLSLDPKEISGNEVEEELFRANYDGLQENVKVMFLYIACLFNDEDVGYVAPVIASNMDLDVSSGLKVLAARSLISLSSKGEIVMHSFHRQMGKEILHAQSRVPDSSKTIERLVDNSQSSMLTQSKNPKHWTTNLSDVLKRFTSRVPDSSKTIERLVDNSQSSMLTQSKISKHWTTNLSDVLERPAPIGPQVFINFRGLDVRNSFLWFLERAMRDANINVFIEDDEIVGPDLNNLLVRIQESRVAVVIFSKDYSRSQRCLDELAQIKECIDQGGLSVIPVFYKIEHSFVQELSGGFGDTFRVLKSQHKHEPERTKKWEEALEYITKLRGIVLSEGSDWNERKFMTEIIYEIQRLLSQIAMKGNPKVESNFQGGFLVPARRLVITHSENPQKWTWSAIYDRPHKADIEIATMINTHSSIKITGDFHTRKLIPGTVYEVLFLVRLDDTSLGWRNEVTLALKLVHQRDGSGSERLRMSNLEEYIGDNWVDIYVGEFEAPPKREDGKIFFSMHQYVDTDKKSGLVVKGFAIRPKQ